MDEVNDALLRISPSEYYSPHGGFQHTHIGTDIKTRKGVIGKHGVPDLNENGRYLLQLCCSNGFRIMNRPNFFQHKNVHKYTWYSLSMEQKIDDRFLYRVDRIVF